MSHKAYTPTAHTSSNTTHIHMFYFMLVINVSVQTMYILILSDKGKDKGVPRQAEVAQGVPVG